jgi:ABC-type transport system substrate-binding protein
MGPLSLRGAVVVVVVLAILASACARPGPTQPAEAAKPAPAGPKVLRIGMYEGEPQTGIALFGGSLVFSRGGIDAPEHAFTFHAGLTVYNERGDITPWIAQKVPTIEDGDWQVFPDGQMELTWKLRPEVKWHDGTSATAADFVFGAQITQDRDMPLRRGEPAGLISSVSAPDRYTLVVRWKSLYPEANVSGPTDIPGVPAHLMEELYRAGDKQAFINSRYWTSEFVGIGAYRLGDWEPGAHLESRASRSTTISSAAPKSIGSSSRTSPTPALSTSRTSRAMST